VLEPLNGGADEASPTNPPGEGRHRGRAGESVHAYSEIFFFIEEKTGEDEADFLLDKRVQAYYELV
jgi:hypothetical protein